MERLTENFLGCYQIKGCDNFTCKETCNNVLNCDYCPISEAIDKLVEYENLDEQGLLLRLPCKVGTSVYMVEQDCGGDALYCRRGYCEGCPDLYEFVEENKFEAYMCDDIGKTVFLTKAEAEQKLKEKESD